MTLTIISHTTHYSDANGKLYGWGPTVREINFLAKTFHQIFHIGCLSAGPVPQSCIPYDAPNIHFIAIPESGGSRITDKFSVLINAPKVIKAINSVLHLSDAVQLRVPTGMANYLLPYFTFMKKKPMIWVKYAGNWKQQNAPTGYRFQRWWLSENYLNSKVTINGKWHDQPVHCYTFENPCLDEAERVEGIKVLESKKYSGPYTACFVGRIEAAKGVERILESLPVLSQKNISTIHFIGDGKEQKHFAQIGASQNHVNCVFHGSVDRFSIPDYLSQSHFLLLPSTASEGFPKVIAEGANYGAIPIVSNISSIGQYIHPDSGFLWDTSISFSEWLAKIEFREARLKIMSKKSYEMAGLFTFEKYLTNLKKNILA